MAVKTRSNSELVGESRIKNLCRVFTKRGITVRREKLARGQSYRVRSGECLFSGEKLVFVDRRLPLQQQYSVLCDYLADYRIELDEEEKGDFVR
jgi:hypothetical protein